MEELFELRRCIELGNYAEALILIGELEEMSKDDKINKIGSFFEVLILHIIKQYAEQRSTRSWEVSIKNAVDAINDVNKRRKGGGFYLSEEELLEIIHRRYQRALRRASLEAFEGQFSEFELADKINEEQIKEKSLQLVKEGMKEGWH